MVFAVLIVFLLWGSIQLFTGIERSFETTSFERQIAVQVETPRNYSLDEKHALFERLYALFDSHREELEIADVSYRYRRSSARQRSQYGGNNRIEIFLLPEEQSELSTLEIRDRIESMLPVIAGVEIKIGRNMRGPPGSDAGVQVELIGDDPAILDFLSEQVTAELKSLPFVKEVESSLESGDEEIHVEVNRERALQAGLSSQIVARVISSALSTRPVTYFKSEDREIGLVVQYREEDRETLDQLKKMNIRTPSAALPIASFASFTSVPGPQTIEREDRRSKLVLQVDTGGSAGSFAMMGAIGGMLAKLELPPGYSFNFGRNFRAAQAEMASTAFAMLFALLLVYMIMAALFESFVHPLTILFAVPFSFIGVGLIMKLANQPRGSASEMGLVILAGVVVNNAIVLIDRINQLRREGLDRNAAIIQGGRDRLRPIIMTAMCTMLGLLPMAAPFLLPSVFGPDRRPRRVLGADRPGDPGRHDDLDVPHLDDHSDAVLADGGPDPVREAGGEGCNDMNRVTASTMLMLAVLLGGCGFLDSRSEAEPSAAKDAAPGRRRQAGGGRAVRRARAGGPGGGRSAAIPVTRGAGRAAGDRAVPRDQRHRRVGQRRGAGGAHVGADRRAPGGRGDEGRGGSAPGAHRRRRDPRAPGARQGQPGRGRARLSTRQGAVREGDPLARAVRSGVGEARSGARPGARDPGAARLHLDPGALQRHDRDPLHQVRAARAELDAALPHLRVRPAAVPDPGAGEGPRAARGGPARASHRRGVPG